MLRRFEWLGHQKSLRGNPQLMASFADDISLAPVSTTAASFAVGYFANSPEKQPNKNWHDLPATELEVRWVDEVDELVDLVPAWNRLAECCLCPNIFYEPQLFIPAWRHLRHGNVRVAIVQAAQRAQPGAPKVLCGILPLELHRTTHGLPLRSAKLWQHLHCFLTTPLLRSDYAQETLTGLFEFLREDGVGILNLPCVSAEGPFQHALIDFVRDRNLAWQLKDVFRRALFVRKESDEAFMEDWPRKRRHELNRLERRLDEAGKLVIEEFHVGDDSELFAEHFLALEAMGWKGLEGTAMSKTQSQARFLKEAMLELASENRLMGLTLRLDDVPVAMKANFLTHNGGFAFKIAYHPEWAKFSPGAILEKLNVTKLHETGRVQWMDSCATPDHPMINTLWPDRRVLQSVAISTGRRGSRAAIAALPLMKYARDWTADLKSKLTNRSRS
ncbi:MAG: GNAT family N-acetyltransferase [Pirellulaceae bacterium]|nr:GNAT family N-acetyltransferase [Pirellulaceae bacterium]